MEANYRIDLSYIGTDYQGWQSQPDGNSIQDYLEKALSTFLRHPVRVIGASRTDSGVHAENQVAIFKSAIPFDEHQWIGRLNGLLPWTIGVKSIKAVNNAFHPIADAVAKTYVYRLRLVPNRNPFCYQYTWTVTDLNDISAMIKESKAFLGRKNFSAFCSVDSSAKTRERTLFEIDFISKDKGEGLEIWVVGDGFLKQMVRTMVGTLVAIGRGRFRGKSVESILASRDRTFAGETAPAKGLSLVDIFYDTRPRLAQIINMHRSSL